MNVSVIKEKNYYGYYMLAVHCGFEADQVAPVWLVLTADEMMSCETLRLKSSQDFVFHQNKTWLK